MSTSYIIGPSHIHSDFTKQVANEIESGKLFSDCILDAYRGIPIWSRHIYNCISKNKNVFWIVSDYKFNNSDYPKIVALKGGELFLDTIGHPGNVFRDFLDRRHIQLLGDHSLKVIDFIVKEFPSIKLIFWCLYKRTKVNKNSSYPKHLWYDVIKERYRNNILDIDMFTTPEEFSLKILDDGAHPNREGYNLLDTMIKSVQK